MPLPERALIAQIRRAASGKRRTELLRGIGDDCAILRPVAGYNFLVTTDFSLENVHFRRDWHPPESVGHRCLARGLSDIAAMGGEPVAAFLSLALPRDVSQSWVDKFMKGFLRLAEKYKSPLAGGDTAQSPGGILADVIVIGRISKDESILRSGARPRDRIYVSGVLGGSAAAIAQLMGTKFETPPGEYGRHHAEQSRISGGAKDLELLDPAGRVLDSSAKRPHSGDYPRHFYPEPRLRLGRTLREQRLVTSMIDLSDGLSTDLAHICEESKVGAEIEAAHIPRAKVGKAGREVDLDLALHGGEDYELLFTARPETSIPAMLAGVPLTEIGQITRQQKVVLIDERGKKRQLRAQGWEHFH